MELFILIPPNYSFFFIFTIFRNKEIVLVCVGFVVSVLKIFFDSTDIILFIGVKKNISVTKEFFLRVQKSFVGNNIL